MDKSQRDGALLILLASACYGFLPVFTKWLYSAGMEPIDVVTWRFIVAAPMMLLGARWLERGRTDGPPVPWKRLLLVGGLFSAAAGTAFVGLQLMSASAYLVLFYTYPAMVAVISVITGEKLSLRFWLALMLTLVGVALTAPEFIAGLSQNVFGAGLALANAGVVAVYYFVSNYVMRGQTRQAQATTWVMFGALIVFIVIVSVRAAFGYGGLVAPPTPDTWLWLFGLGTICTAL
ncbi:MAG: DMT family transporter, partial [Burkholderiales bacterium]|nr:DMT family transporter [Anaerolineae bacterium]